MRSLFVAARNAAVHSSDIRVLTKATMTAVLGAAYLLKSRSPMIQAVVVVRAVSIPKRGQESAGDSELPQISIPAAGAWLMHRSSAAATSCV